MSYMSFHSSRLVILASLLAAAVSVFGQRPVNLPAVSAVSVVASVTPAGPLYSYSYQFLNASSSTAGIWRISLDIKQSAGAAPLQNPGLTNGSCYLSNVSARVLANPKTPPMIPVAFNAPPQWLCGPSGDGTAQWGATSASAQVVPGRQASGFQLVSAGLPGIRTVKLEPQVDLSQLSIPVPVDDSPTQIGSYLNQVAAVRAGVSFYGTTIGPTAPPITFVPASFLAAIISYKEQAFAQGWIDNGGIKNSLDAKLNAAQTALSSGDQKEAINQLNALLNEVGAQAGKHLSPEAVALLQFNTQYLISQLP
jgi:hypothetical protein